MDQSQTKSLLSKTSETETPRGLIGLNEEEIEIELQTNTYAIDRNKTVVIIEPESIYDLQIGTFLKPPPLTKNHNDPEGLFLEDLPNETLYKIFEYVPIQKLGYLSMTCSGFDELLDDDDFWIKVAQFNDHLFIWKSLKIYSNSEGNSSIIGSLNDSIIVHNNNYENVFEKRISEGSFTKFLRSRSIGLFELSEKMGLIKKKSLCKPHTNKRIRVEYIKSLLNSRYETIERYTFLKNACKLKKDFYPTNSIIV
ncbi:dactylin [Anaeramoeba flamelloides]|uniref:Dactylin n=1 Tax=Anaeramoeba flamelloides TaxID=1746091 RepID=A0ABQ8ZDC7_9EUKA|nr:dactylin [Anaeramoeba flamelloides]